MKKIKTLFILTSLLILGSCETFDMEQTDSKSQVPTQLLEPVYAFNYVQLQLPVFVDDANDFTQRVTRQMAMTGGNTYENAFKPVNFNTVWSDGYNILNAVKIMEPKAIANSQTYILGASKLIRVYVLMTMVDMFGDIPYSEALQGNANLTPKFDKDSDVYRNLLVEIDDAIAYLNQDNANDTKVQDLYYDSKIKWKTLANTLKLKLYNNARLAGAEIGVANIGDTINSLIANNNIIDTIEEDFQFQYGNSRFNPNTRHPLYNDQYELGGGAYIGNYIMWAMLKGKSVEDPRTKFYFLRQGTLPTNDPFTIPKKSRPEHYNLEQYRSIYNNARISYLTADWISTLAASNYTSNDYLGRDHGDNSGIPPDATLRAVAGIYPIGGAYNNSVQNVQASGTAGSQGAGIMPILLSSYVKFILAEVDLEINNSPENALAKLKSGIDLSITKTTTFIKMPSNIPPASTIQTMKDNYISNVETSYSNPSTSLSKKLEIIITEYYIASWGNGIEPYNNYRRTGYPSNFQPTLEEDSGPFFYRALYPGSVENNNPNMPGNVRTKKVFWDKLTTDLH